MAPGAVVLDHFFRLKDFPFTPGQEAAIARLTEGGWYPEGYQRIIPVLLEVDRGVFTAEEDPFPEVVVTREDRILTLTCPCETMQPSRLCRHQSLVLNALANRREFHVFFDQEKRYLTLRDVAADYGMEDEPDLDRFFGLEYNQRSLRAFPLNRALIPVTRESLQRLGGIPEKPAVPETGEEQLLVVLRPHKYYGYLCVELYRAPMARNGKPRNPLTAVSPLDQLWTTEEPASIKFFSGIQIFQQKKENTEANESELSALRAIIRNPDHYPFFLCGSTDKVTATALKPVFLRALPQDIHLHVEQQGTFFGLSGDLKMGHERYPLQDMVLRLTYFLEKDETLYLVDNLRVLGILDLFRKRGEELLIHHTRYETFRKEWLDKLADHIRVDYRYLPEATAEQLQAMQQQKIIYLSDEGKYVNLTPVMRYGTVEIPIRSKRPIYSVDELGREFSVHRDEEAEVAFMALLTRQHPDFDEQQYNDWLFFYLVRHEFLNDNWFLETFADWRANGVTILGFNQLRDNRKNGEKVSISLKVHSGINWFNILFNVRFGKARASLKQLYKAVRNKNKYVELDDGTQGLLPAEWLDKFAAYFNSGEIVDEQTLQTSRINFSAIDQLYDPEMLDEQARADMAVYREKLSGFEYVKETEVPAELQATLRPYQKFGLDWLNFLDEFGFGGCLADDMGLGKSIQILAFLLAQRRKNRLNTNLLVVPTSLLKNWENEAAKFAPDLKIHVLYGADRERNTRSFESYEIILTTYGTLVTDVSYLKNFTFNYIVLDESQNIKNPESQRHKAARLLKARNRIVVTGTPIENNTFDLFGQLSFACPGLLGSKQYFKDIYAAPIDRFKDRRRAAELQNKVRPFILRRTKNQVAGELPEKTEMVLFCEMGTEQKKIYDAYEKEFRDFVAATTGDDLKKTPMNVLKGLLRLRQICNSPLLPSTTDKLAGDASAKIDILLEQILEKSPRHKILVFSQFVTMLELIRKELDAREIGYSWLTGASRNRGAIVQEFQEDPDKRVFLLSLKAGGTGLNLTEADYVYLVDPWWNPAVENQAIDRVHRIGQDKHVIAVRLITPGTVEEKMMKLQATKKDLATDLIQSGSSFFDTLSKADLLSLLS
jgi:SNF2 family DNA or RNA helicase